MGDERNQQGVCPTLNRAPATPRAPSAPGSPAARARYRLRRNAGGVLGGPRDHAGPRPRRPVPAPEHAVERDRLAVEHRLPPAVRPRKAKPHAVQGGRHLCKVLHRPVPLPLRELGRGKPVLLVAHQARLPLPPAPERGAAGAEAAGRTARDAIFSASPDQ